MNKQLITEDWCWQIYADIQAKVMEANWLEQANLEGDEFMAYLEKWTSYVEQYQPNGFLVDSRKGHIVISIEIQEWHDTKIIPRYIGAGVKKIAFILPDDIFAVVSLEQTFSEKASRKIDTRYFADIEEARIWLYES